MVVDGGGLQRKTVTSILMAWVFTYRRRFFFWWVVLIALQLIYPFLKMPGPGDRAFPFFH